MEDFKQITIPRKRKLKEKSTSSIHIRKKLTSNEPKESSNDCCPICQFQLSGRCSSENIRHIEHCSGARENADECPDGENCRESTLDHYSEFSHFALALVRSNQGAVKLEYQDLNDNKVNELWSSTECSVSKTVKEEEQVGEVSDCSSDNVELTKVQSESSTSRNTDTICPPHNHIVCSVRGQIIFCNDVATSKNLSVKQGILSDVCNLCSNSPHKLINVETEVDIKTSSEETLKESFLSWGNNPVNLELSYNNSGWKKLSVCCPREFDIMDLQLHFGKCCHILEIMCTIGKKNKLQVYCINSSVSFDFSSLGLNCSNSPESSILKKIFFDHQQIYLEDKNVDLQKSKVEYKNKVEDKISVNENTCDQFTGNGSCNFNSSYDMSLLDIHDDIVKSVKNQSDSKEKWKTIFKKKVSTETFPQQSHYKNDKKQCPFYKRIPGTSFAVDAFQYGVIQGVTHYFLTHFHADHYGGLSKKFKQKIICSNITASLVHKKLRVEPQYLQVVKCEEIFSVNGVIITPLDANHCPGSLMFLFQLNSGKCYLHVGDFRASSNMKLYPAFSNINIDILFLDTTYCNPQYEFPSQNEVVSAVIRISKRYIRLEPATLIVSGTYTIGKEKVFVGIAEALGSNIWAPKSKLEVLRCLHDKFIDSKLVEYPCKAQVHVWPMTKLNHSELEQHLKDCSQVFKRVLAFSPSGWNFKKLCSLDDAPANTRGRVTIIGVPYSEHSSFTELHEFVKFLKPGKVVPTVAPKNLSFSSTAQCCNKWLTEEDEKTVPDRQQKITSFIRTFP